MWWGFYHRPASFHQPAAYYATLQALCCCVVDIAECEIPKRKKKKAEKNDAFYLPLINQSQPSLVRKSFFLFCTFYVDRFLHGPDRPARRPELEPKGIDEHSSGLDEWKDTLRYGSVKSAQPLGRNEAVRGRGWNLFRHWPSSLGYNRIAIQWPSDPIDHRVIDMCLRSAEKESTDYGVQQRKSELCRPFSLITGCQSNDWDPL